MHRVRFFVVLLFALALFVVPAAHGVSSDVVISQLYAGGGNSGATYTNDFVELFNRGSSSVDLSSWTVQYSSAAGTTWQPTALSGSLQPGHYYLVQLASAAAVGSPLPAPDAIGTTNLAASGGKVAVVRSATALTCGATAGSCSADANVVDLIGYGGATDYEGSEPAAGLNRPRNSATAAAQCSGGQPPAESVSQSAAVDIDIQQVLSIALERPSISFGNASSGQTPAAVSERVTVSSNNAAGYALTVHRSAFQPADLPLGLSATAPGGGQIGPQLGGGAMAAIPIAPAPDLLVGSTTARSAQAGDVWQTNVGFTAPLPVVAPGHYAATVTFTVIGR